MPYADIASLPPAVKKLPENKQRQWMHVWNSAHTKCMGEGGDAKTCETSAFAQAWGVVRKSFEDEDGIFVSVDKLGDNWDNYADEVEKSTASINDLPDSDFAYIEPGGTKDESGKTVPRSLRHFPIHDANHVQNALARMNQSEFGSSAKSKILAAAHRFGIKLDPDKWKSAEGREVQNVVKVVQGDAARGLFYGVVYTPNEVDTQGDFATAEDIEKAAHDFLPNAVMNLHHTDDLEDVQVVESYIAPCDFSIGDQLIRKGAWVLVTRVHNEELKKAILSGEITGYSLEGTCTPLEYN